MRYTLENGFDRQIKQRLEHGALYALPLAIIGIVGFASLTSNSTTGGGIGSPSKGKGGDGSVAITWDGSSGGHKLVSSNVGDGMQNSAAVSHPDATGASNATSSSSAAASNPTGGSVTVNPGLGGGETTVTTPVTPPATVTTPVVTTDPTVSTGDDGISVDLPVTVNTPVLNAGLDVGVDTDQVADYLDYKRR